MNSQIAVTDFGWYEFLARQGPLDEVNFWRPSDTRTPRRLTPGTPFIFKLKEKHGGAIVGFGLYARHALLPAWFAWETFEKSNGAATFEEMLARIHALRSQHRSDDPREQTGQYRIGCLMIASPVFFEKSMWIRPPRDWPKNAVQGSTYDLAAGEGKRVWTECQERASGIVLGEAGEPLARDVVLPAERYGSPQQIRPRLGQGIFRIAVLDAYGNACTVTTEHSLPVLEAAHIRPYADGGAHEIRNGLPLRKDIHQLFDRGYVTITPDHRFLVSQSLRDQWQNGLTYYEMHGRAIQLPGRQEDHPDPQLLEWHTENRFVG